MINIYQIYYKEGQKSNLLPIAKPFFNTDLTPFFENEIIRDFYNDNKITGEYFGILSWKFRTKRNTIINLDSFAGSPDILIPFFPYHETHPYSILEEAERCHPQFINLFHFILDELKLPYLELQVPIYENAVIAKSHIYKKYVREILLPVMSVIENIPEDSEEYKILWSNSNYRGYAKDNPVFQKLGVDYFPYHTFICERLWSYFVELYKSQYKLRKLRRLDHRQRQIEVFNYKTKQSIRKIVKKMFNIQL
ncbi:MAG: hypothetical protein AB4058_05160 [Microcystaceae cyanobacterium]